MEFDDLFKEEKVNEVIFNKPSFIHSDVTKVIKNGNVVVVMLNTKDKGVARCHEDDEFDLETGYKIAYNRAVISKLESEIKNTEYILKEQYNSSSISQLLKYYMEVFEIIN